MAVRDILKMGDPRLLRVAQPVTAFNTPTLQALLKDLDDTMLAANGAGLAAPQIGVDLQVVIFGSGEFNPRYPEAPVVPHTHAQKLSATRLKPKPESPCTKPAQTAPSTMSQRLGSMTGSLGCRR